MTGEPDIVRAKQKINEGTDWRGSVNVTLGDESVTFEHRLLNENEFLEVQRVLDTSDVDLDEQENVGQTEAQERLLELQQKDELDEEEEQELQRLSQEVMQQTDEIEDVIGKEGYDLFMELGRDCIEPSEDDVEHFYNDPVELKSFAGLSSLPNPLTKDAVADILRGELQKMVTKQPYPIKINVGLQAFSETISILGNESPA